MINLSHILFLIFFLIQINAVQAQRLPAIALWHEGVPNANPEGGAEIVTIHEKTGEHLISNVNDPSITPFLPSTENTTGIALVIAPGGAHKEIWIDHEGYNIAQRLVKSGIACFVLKYRLSRDKHSNYTLDNSVEDMQQAVRLVRSRALEWNIDPEKIGVMGFSAGGQVTALTDIQTTNGNPDADELPEKFSSRPNFQALIYPAWTNNMKLTKQSSPAFIICGFHDMESISTGVPELYLKFKKLNIPAELHIYANADHGFGIRKGNTGPSSKWPDALVEWLYYMNGITAQPQEFNHKIDLKEVGINPNKIEAIDSLLQSFIDQKKLNCIEGFVAKGGNVIYNKAFGWKDVENKIPATVDDYYVLFSQTKAITTVAFMTLVEKGLVKIDDQVSDYFPEIPDQVVTKVNEDGTYETRPVTTPMTFVHLMSHSSGLNAGLVRQIKQAERKSNDTPAGFGGIIPKETPSGQHSGGGNYNAKYLKEEMIALSKYPLGFDPGSEWSYHISTNMLAYMVERISGQPLRDYVKENILIPLGMDDTDWYYEPEKLNRFVKAYAAVDGKLEPATNIYSEGTISEQQTYCEGAIGLNGPIEDYAKFCQMLLNKGEFNGHRILKPETIELMTTINRLPEVNSGGKGFQFGLGFELYNELKKPVPAVSNSAFAWGGMFGTAYIIDPENNLIALFYMNMTRHESLYPLFLSKVYELAKE